MGLSSADRLPSLCSADSPLPLFADFLAVGSEVAHLRAGHRQPLKLYVQFSLIQPSRRLPLTGCNRRDRLNQVHQPELVVQLGFRQLSTAAVPPPLESLDRMRRTIQPSSRWKSFSDVGSLVGNSRPLPIASRLEHRLNQAQHPAIGYSLGHERERFLMFHSLHLMLRPASLLAALSQAFNAPLWSARSHPPPGRYRALRRSPGRIFHPREI
jgi:hypothetical protein